MNQFHGVRRFERNLGSFLINKFMKLVMNQFHGVRRFERNLGSFLINKFMGIGGSKGT